MGKEILIADSDKGDQEEFKKIFEMRRITSSSFPRTGRMRLSRLSSSNQI